MLFIIKIIEKYLVTKQRFNPSSHLRPSSLIPFKLTNPPRRAQGAFQLNINCFTAPTQTCIVV